MYFKVFRTKVGPKDPLKAADDGFRVSLVQSYKITPENATGFPKGIYNFAILFSWDVL